MDEIPWQHWRKQTSMRMRRTYKKGESAPHFIFWQSEQVKSPVSCSMKFHVPGDVCFAHYPDGQCRSDIPDFPFYGVGRQIGCNQPWNFIQSLDKILCPALSLHCNLSRVVRESHLNSPNMYLFLPFLFHSCLTATKNKTTYNNSWIWNFSDLLMTKACASPLEKRMPISNENQGDLKLNRLTDNSI